MVQFFATNQDGEQSVTVFGAGWQKPVAGSHPNFAPLMEYLLSKPDHEHDEDYVRGLVDPTVGIGKALQEQFGDRVSFDLHHIRIDGMPVQGGAANALKQRLLSGDQDWLRFAKFLVNLDRNPSMKAKDAVWAWVEGNGLTITEDGRFLGYKGVSNEGESLTSGPNNFVNGVLYREGDSTVVPYDIGNVVSKRRADVDDTPGGGCSVGLHVGTESYAKNWGPLTITVAVDPADVVSAPDGSWANSLDYKIRVCKLEVISMADDKQFEGTSYDLGVESEYTDAAEEGSSSSSWSYPTSYLPGISTAQAFQVAEQEAAETGEPVVFAEQVDKTTWTLKDYAGDNPHLLRDLQDRSMGHKPLAAKWSDYTTEASVRRYRKANGITLNIGAKVRDAVS